MKYLKISNLKNEFGQIDYKGLDINQFIPGSQVYSEDLTFCLIATTQNINTFPVNVSELLKDDYFTQRQTIESQLLSNVTNPLVDLQAQNAQIILALVASGVM